MTNIGDLLGNTANEILRSNISIGDVHLLCLDHSNGITPKNGDATRNKFFIVLGFNHKGDIIGGLVINSKINNKLSSEVTDYQLPISVKQCPFLKHNSFVNCSKIIIAPKTRFNKSTYRGVISDSNLMKAIMDTIKESPLAERKILKEFGLI